MERGPLLTESQYDWLTEVDTIDGTNSDERTRRARIRQRVRDGIQDFSTLYEHLPEDDRQQLFDALRSDKSEVGKEFADTHVGISSFLALLYEATSEDPTRDFETFLKNAMERVGRRNGWFLEEFDLTIEFNKEIDWDERQHQFEAGDLTNFVDVTELYQRGKISKEEYIEFVESQPPDRS